MKKSDKKEVLISKNAAEAPASLKEWKKPCSLEAEMMFAGLEKAKSALAGILANARKLFSDDIKAEIAKEALQISAKDLENLKAALGKGSFYFPLFSAEIGSGQSLSADTDREFGPIVNLIKKDLLDLAVTLEELSPTFSEFITGVPSETSRALRLLPSSEKDEWLNSNSFSLRIHPLVKLVEFNQKEAFFNYFYRYLSLKSKSTIKSLDALGESAEVFLSNALNTNFSPSDPSFFRKKDIDEAAFLFNIGLDKNFVARATNLWTVKLMDASDFGLDEIGKRADLSAIDGTDPVSESTYRIFITFYNLLAQSEENQYLDLKAFALSLLFIRMFAEESDCWKALTDTKIDASTAFTILVYQTFNWSYKKTATNIFDRSNMDKDSYNKYCRPRLSRFPVLFALITQCPVCKNDFLATNSINYYRSCPICEGKVLL